MSDKRLYPNTVIFKGTEDNEITYINERVLEQIRAEVKKMDTLITRSEVLEVIDNCMKGEHE